MNVLLPTRDTTPKTFDKRLKPQAHISHLYHHQLSASFSSNRTPGVLAVAVAFAEIIVFYYASTAFEFEIGYSCRVFIVEYSMPERSYEWLR